MSRAEVYEGTWEELALHADELRSYPRLTLIVPERDGASNDQQCGNISVRERIRLMDAFTLSNVGLPLLPDSAFDRETLYSYHESV